MIAGSHPTPTPTDPIVPPGAVLVEVCARTDIGMSREHNEDAYLITDLAVGEPMPFGGVMAQRPSDRGVLFMVADGMGGAAAGEVASEMAVGVVLEEMLRRWRDAAATGAEPFVAALRGATQIANASIHRRAAEQAELRGMGTTATIAGLLGDTLYLAQVGDSRAYLVREGAAIQITKDQSLMQKLIDAGEITSEEAEHSERRNIILQALGPELTVKVDLTHQPLRRGDVLVLCSDGLSGLVRPEQIAKVVGEASDVEQIAGRLIDLANAAGGPDNITVIAARFDGTGLREPSSDDVVGHQHFGPPDPVTPISVPAILRPQGVVESERQQPTLPAPAAPPAPSLEAFERRIRGQRYVRGIAALGVLLLLLLLWRFFTTPR